MKILQGRDQLEQEAFLALQAHYLFKAEFANVRKGNEEGRVEGTVGYVRRNALVPYPQLQYMEELNEYPRKWCLREAEKLMVPNTTEPVKEVWEREKTKLYHLPADRFEACRLISCQVNKTSLITIETNQYSVPTHFVGQVL